MSRRSIHQATLLTIDPKSLAHFLTRILMHGLGMVTVTIYEGSSMRLRRATSGASNSSRSHQTLTLSCSAWDPATLCRRRSDIETGITVWSVRQLLMCTGSASIYSLCESLPHAFFKKETKWTSHMSWKITAKLKCDLKHLMWNHKVIQCNSVLFFLTLSFRKPRLCTCRPVNSLHPAWPG